MNIEIAYPPNIEKIRAAFDLHPGIVFTYGDTIYNPDGGAIGPALMAHEKTHAKQQGDDPEAWWDRYFIDPQWRSYQELAAYRKQFKEFKKNVHDREARHQVLVKLAQDMASPMYGNCVTFQHALKAIKHDKLF